MSINPYESPQHTGELYQQTPHVGFRYVGFWWRVLASLIDSLLLSAVTFPVLIGVYGWDYFQSTKMVQGPVHFLISYIFPAVAIVLFWIYKSATPGKMVISARIVDAETGEHPTNSQMIIRYLGYYLSSIVCLLGFLWVAFDPKKQGWHDKLAKTVVVRY